MQAYDINGLILDKKNRYIDSIMTFDIAIIGGGMAGFSAALHCSGAGFSVGLFERNKTFGRKLLVSGSGQCNITHAGSVDEFLPHYGNKGRFLKPSLYGFPNSYVLDFFRKQSVEFTTDSNGKIFPLSLKSSDILNVLLAECASKGVSLLSSKKIETLTKCNEGFEICGASFSVKAYAVIVSAGGASFPTLGSDGAGSRLAESLGHTIVPLRPALTPVSAANFQLAELAGISFPGCHISLWRNSKKVGEYKGDLLITHTGLSGPVILDNSRYMRPGDTIAISFLTKSQTDELEHRLAGNERGTLTGGIRTILSRNNLPKRLCEKICALCGVDELSSPSQLTRDKRKMLGHMIADFQVVIGSLAGFDTAFVTAGGVSTDEINPKTLESRLVPRLYFAGETIDYDGDTGGYNLQAAFSTGALAGSSVKNFLLSR
jgi:predicted Rossmann fold flavoprotein